MQGLAEILDTACALPIEQRYSHLERGMLGLPQAACPLDHHFGPGVYVRVLQMVAGTVALGHHQKFEHLNILLQGAVRMLNDDGSTTDLRAPLIFTGKPGRKAGVVLEDLVWANVYATDERDIAALEARLIEKSPEWVAEVAGLEAARRLACEGDRQDYAAMLAEGGLTEEQAQAQTKELSDQLSMPAEGGNVRIRASRIHGQGVFLNAPVEPFHVIAPAVIAGQRTPAGRYTNHSAEPNACMVRRLDGGIDLVALERIEGCRAGQEGDEVTIDYRRAARLVGHAPQGGMQCQ